MRRFALLLLLILPSFGFEWPGRVDRIRHALERVDAEERRELVRELGHYPEKIAENALLFALEDNDPDVRLEAADAAGRVHLHAGVPILLDWLDDKEADARKAAVAALGHIAEPRTLDPLVRALGDASADVRSAAVRALLQLGGPEVVEPIVGRLDDLDIGVRVEAIHALAALHDGRAVVPLLGVVLDPSAELRALALRTLGEIGDPQALSAITRGLSDQVEDVQLAAASALGALKDAGSVRALKAALPLVEARIGHAVVTALGAIDDDGARIALIEQLAVPGLRRVAAEALFVQAQRIAHAGKPETAQALVTVLATALDEHTELGTQLAVADALAQVASVLPIDAALPRMLAALQSAQGELASTLVQALGRSHANDALMPLVERVAQSKDDALHAVLDALRSYFERTEPDGRAADPLLEALPTARPSERPLIVELLGRVHAVRALPVLVPLLDHADGELRRTVARALGEIGSSQAAPGLLAALDHDDAATRFEAALALGPCADAAAAHALVARLAAGGGLDPHAVVLALGGALHHLAAEHALPKALLSEAHAQLLVLITGSDETLAARAIDALANAGAKESLEPLTFALRTRSSRVRSAATLALSAMDPDAAHPIVRYMMLQGNAREVTAALAVLGEVGDHRDLKAIYMTAKRKHWPVPGAAAYAIHRLAMRGALRAHADQAELCAMAGSREPYVRANIAATLAVLGLGSCGETGPDPLRWLGAEHATVVRIAAAHWTHAALAAGRLDQAEASHALASCASTDVEQSVRAACAQAPAPAAVAPVDVYAYRNDGVSRMLDQLVALRFSDGSVFLGRTDVNGHVRLHTAPAGAIELENPGDTELEPLD